MLVVLKPLSDSTFNDARYLNSKSINSVASDSSASSEFNEAFLNSKNAALSTNSSSVTVQNDTGDTVNAPPRVDRSLKAKLLLAHASGPSQKVSEVLEAEEELAEESLQLEQQELRLEKEVEVLRIKKEKEAGENMRAEMAKNEEVLLAELKKLSDEKRRRDEENDDLRMQLQNLKKELESNVAQRVNEAVGKRVEEVIRAKDEERRRLQAEVEAKRAARKRNKAEEERKRKERELARESAEAARRRREQYAEEKRKAAGLPGSGPGITRMPLKDEPSSSSNLSRSFSSPNIAQMLEEEDRKAAIPAPKFDRSSKPSSAAAGNRAPRNFQPIWGTGKKGLTGLKNLGNTCYMNSILQCLSNFTLPSQYFMDAIFERDINTNSETKGEVAEEYSELVRALWSGQYKSIAPVDLKRVVGRYRSCFAGFSQQDAHEFLLFLMDMMHNDVNEIRGKVRLPEVDFDKVDEITGAMKALELDKLADKSFIRETFYGQRKSSLQCLTCGYESPKYESFFELALTLPEGNGKCSLKELIANELKPEKVEWTCPKCKRTNAHKKIDIVKFPLILTIHLKRFKQEAIWTKKQNYVDFELNSLDLGQFARACGGRLNRYREYRLYGVANHFGTMEGGHYTAYCYSQVYDKWHKYDDHEVSSMSPSSVKTSAAYILFYSAKN